MKSSSCRDWAGPIKKLRTWYTTNSLTGVAKPIKFGGVATCMHTRYDVFQVPTENLILATGWMLAGKTYEYM